MAKEISEESKIQISLQTLGGIAFAIECRVNTIKE